ncbi:MAG: hypothetical protein PHW04_10690 [Candidatus Wallbacteria bacterium]|nr:hypothetical protein [Candidatus Wallbacteria bacterium]
MRLSLFFSILALILISFPLWGAVSTDDQLKSNGYSDVQKYFDARRVKKENPMIPEAGTNAQAKQEANKIYRDLYEITPAEEKEIPEKRDIYYYPGLIGPSFYGVSGLTETITARTVDKSHYRIGGRFQYRTITKTNGQKIAFGSGEKADVQSFPTAVTIGLVDHFEAGFVLPITSWDINTPYLNPSNEKESAVGDAMLMGKFGIPLNDKNTSGMALCAGFKFPSGNDKRIEADGSTGQTDFTMMAAMSSKAGLANCHINVGYTFTGDPQYSDVTHYWGDDKILFRMGVDFSHNEDVTIGAELATEDWGNNGNKVELIPSVRARFDEDFMVEMAMPVDVHNTEYYGYNFRLSAGLCYIF